MSDTNPKCQQGVEPTAIEARLYRALVGYLRECEGGPELLREFEALEPLRQDELRDDNAALKARCEALEAGLRPFSQFPFDDQFPREPDDFIVARHSGSPAVLSAGDWRRARALLSPRDGEAK